MTKTTSLYLDVVRLLAAVAVFLLHSTFQGITGGFLWQLGTFGEDSVMAFFILSGYVIMFCAECKHTSFSDYIIARLSRLWSVVIPALMLTAVFDAIRFSLHGGELKIVEGAAILPYALSAFFANQLWFIHATPGSNGPFWSISYEFVYYVLLGAVVFAPKRWRWLLAFLICIIAGPKIVLLLPIWLMGVLAYHLGKTERRMIFGWLLWIGSIVAFMAYYIFLKRWISQSIAPGEIFNNGVFSNAELISRYIFSFFIFCNIVGFRIVEAAFCPILLRFEGAIKKCASYSFSLYLYHFPLLVFFSALTRDGRGQWWSIAVIYSGTIFIILALAPITEWRKDFISLRLNRFSEWCARRLSGAGNGVIEKNKIG